MNNEEEWNFLGHISKVTTVKITANVTLGTKPKVKRKSKRTVRKKKKNDEL